MPKPKTKTFVLHPNEALLELVDKLQNDPRNAYSSKADVWYQAVREMYARQNPAYKLAVQSRPPRTAKEKVIDQEAQKTARKQIKEDEKLAIAEALGGKLIDYGTAGKNVQWYTYYGKGGRDLQEMPLEMLTKELIDNQFSPSREEVEKHQVIILRSEEES